MAFVLVVVGLLMIITGARGTYQQFGSQVASDFTGPGNFTYWLAAIGIIGAIGYIEPLKTVSRLFMALVLIGMVLSNRGVFAKFQAAMKAGPVAPQAPSTATQGGASGVTTQSGSDGKTPYNPGTFLKPLLDFFQGNITGSQFMSQ